MTGAGVFVLRDPATLVPMQAASFASEDDFQRLLAAFPELLAGDQIDAAVPRRFLLVSREQPVASEEGGAGRWSLDHLFLDQDGIPTLVEVKRGTDTRIRREVVGQMLDYAANSIVYWPVEELRMRFVARCEQDGKDPVAELGALLGGEDAADADAFWARVRTNLQAGRIRMLFVADRIPSELKRIVEFLNGQMQPAEVLALELRQFEGQGLRTLVPVLIGRTEEATQKKGTGGSASLPRDTRAWDEDSVLAGIAATCGPDLMREVHRIAAWTRDKADRVYVNSNATWGAMGPLFERGGTKAFYPFLIGTDATIGIYFQYMAGRPVFDDMAMRRELLVRLNAVPGFELPESALTKRPPVKLELFARPGATDDFLATMDWFVAQLPVRGAVGL